MEVEETLTEVIEKRQQFKWFGNLCRMDNRHTRITKILYEWELEGSTSNEIRAKCI